MMVKKQLTNMELTIEKSLCEKIKISSTSNLLAERNFRLKRKKFGNLFSYDILYIANLFMKEVPYYILLPAEASHQQIMNKSLEYLAKELQLMKEEKDKGIEIFPSEFIFFEKINTIRDALIIELNAQELEIANRTNCINNSPISIEEKEISRRTLLQIYDDREEAVGEFEDFLALGILDDSLLNLNRREKKEEFINALEEYLIKIQDLGKEYRAIGESIIPLTLQAG